jgi:hypothetical protein
MTFRPSCIQTMTIQPDGYVTWKDAGMIPVEGLELNHFREAAQKA